jgi:hypothetical protein
LWKQDCEHSHLRDEAKQVLGYSVALVLVKLDMRVRWEWSVDGLSCSGMCKILEEARAAAIEAVLNHLGTPRKFTAYKELVRLAGYR